tara:strand:+ start:376 stop:765 length:390 start_codon:yes stop_codon:yes gene_type:complete
MPRQHTHQETITEGDDSNLYDTSRYAEHECRIVFTVAPGRPARLFGPAENCHPEEPAEIEVVNVHHEVTTIAGKPRWFDAPPALRELVTDLVDTSDNLRARLLEHAAEADEAARESALEARAEERRLAP